MSCTLIATVTFAQYTFFIFLHIISLLECTISPALHFLCFHHFLPIIEVHILSNSVDLPPFPATVSSPHFHCLHSLLVS